MEAGKDYFTDKKLFTTLDQLNETKRVIERTGQKYMVYYTERIHVEGAVFSSDFIADGAIGRVIHVTGFGPHRIKPRNSRKWFLKKKHMMAFYVI